MTTAQLADLLRSRPGGEAAEVQVAGSASWTSSRAFSDDFADCRDPDDVAEAVAQLLLAAEQLRNAAHSNLAAEPEPGRSDRRRRPFRPRHAIAAALLPIISTVMYFAGSASPRSNAVVFHQLQHLHRSVDEVHRRQNPTTDSVAIMQRVAVAARDLSEELEATAETLPLLSLQRADIDADDLLARRELLAAARDLERLAMPHGNNDVLEADFRRRLQVAADLLDQPILGSEGSVSAP